MNEMSRKKKSGEPPVVNGKPVIFKGATMWICYYCIICISLFPSLLFYYSI